MAVTTRARGRRRTAAALTGAVLAGILGVLLAPSPPSPGPDSTGDPALAAHLRGLAESGGRPGLVAAVLDEDRVTAAGVGDDGRGTPLDTGTPFEIGSVTKTITGAVLAELERRGVVRGSDRVRDVVPGRPWGPVGDVTLAELAAHRSGLPIDSGGVPRALRNVANGLLGTPPAARTAEQVFAAADAAPLGPRGRDVYSNLAFALLGQVLAERTATPYPQLAEQIVTGPLGMTTTGFPGGPPPGAAVGHDRGRPVHPWVSAGDAPAGIGNWSTVDDVVRYVRALDVPGSAVAAAARPRFPTDLGRIGYGWETLERDGRSFVWKNGGSGGISTSVLVEPGRDRAAVVFGTSDDGVDPVALALLDAPALFGDDSGGPDPVEWVQLVVGAAFPVYAGLAVLVTARGGWRGGPVRRPAVVGASGTALLFLVLAWVRGDVGWLAVPVWALGGALLGAGLGIAAARWDEPTAPDGSGRWGAGIGVLLGVGALVAVVGSALTV